MKAYKGKIFSTAKPWKLVKIVLGSSFLLLSLVLIASTTIAEPASPFAELKRNNQEGIEDTLQIDLANFVKESWSQEERENAVLIIDFVQHLMINHDFDYVKSKFGANPYTQHNRGMNDGMEGVIEFVSKFAKRYPDFTYDVRHIYVDGDYVIFHSHATIKKKHRTDPNKGMNIMDIWRVENGQIVEHWDSIQAVDRSMRFYVLMSGGKVKNSNTLY